MTWIRLLLFLLITSLAVPATMFQSSPRQTPVTGPAGAVAASLAPAWAPVDADTPRIKRKGKNHRQKDARKRDRARQSSDERDRQAPPPRLPDRSDADGRTGPTRKERSRQWKQKCGAPGSIKLGQSEECTHGPDPAPPGFSVTRAVQPLAHAAARAASAGVVCDGNGQSGPRIEVLYVRATNVSSRYAAFLPSFRAWASDADTILQESAATVGGSRNFRWATTGCVIDVTEVTVSPAGDGDFDTTIAELKAQGYDRTNRKYLIFVDTTSAGICGIGNLWNDDSPGQANWNNYGPSYARVDAGCWDGYTAAHEIMHNLGGVQLSAPNTSGGFHCIDEYDVMCYSDNPDYPTMRIDCPQFSQEEIFDCGRNDYFHPSPPAGSYLATHWNSANNRFLIGGGSSDENGTPPTISWVSPVANGETHQASAGTIALEATATDEGGINRVLFLRLDESDHAWVPITSDNSAPYEATLPVADLHLGFNNVTAKAYDGLGNATTQHIWIKRVAPPAPVRLTSPRNRAKVKGKKSVAIRAQVSGALAEVSAVEFRVCNGTGCAWDTARPIATDASAPYSASWKAPKKGKATFLAQVTHANGVAVSDPVTITIKKAKKKRKRR